MKKSIFKKKELRKDAVRKELKKQGFKKKDIKKTEAARKTAGSRKKASQKDISDHKAKGKTVNYKVGSEQQVGTAAQRIRPDRSEKTAEQKNRTGRPKTAGRYTDPGRRGKIFGIGNKLKKENENGGREPAPSLRIIPLGGLEQIGMNITAFEFGDSIVVVDCGLAFPEDDMFGIDLVIPDTSYLEENVEKVKGFVITHGHEDHIGALPYVLKKINVPIYGTRLTMGIIENKLREHNLLEITERHVVSFGDIVELGDFDVEFIKTNHSIVDAAALAIAALFPPCK